MFEKVLWTVPIVGVVVAAIMWAWTFDDGFIYFRTVDQILAGNGPVFNAGERVESFTSPLWLTTLTVGDVLSPARLEYTAAALSILCTLVGFATATLASAKLSRFDRPAGIRLPLGLVVLAVLWPIWVWATSGLEVGLSFAWIGGCFYVLMRWAGPQPDPVRDPTADGIASDGSNPGASTIGTGALVLLGLGWLVRPELVVSSALFVGVAVSMSTTDTRRRWRLVATGAAIPVVYQVFRMGYYGMLVSSPSVAKEGSVARPGRGWEYFTNFVGPYVLALPLIVIIFAIGGPMIRSILSKPNRRPLVVASVVAGSGALHMVAIIMVGGDYVHARLLLPGLFALLAPFFVVVAARRYLEGFLVTFGWAVVCLLWLRPSDNPSDGIGTGFPGESLIYEDRGFDERGIDQPWIDGPGVYLASGFGPGASPTGFLSGDPEEVVVATGAVGAFGYVLGPDARIVDIYGLADPLTAHQRLAFRSVPGHEKMMSGPWLVAILASDPSSVRPDAVITENWWIPDPPPLDYMHEVAWASAVLNCSRIEDFRSSFVGSFGAGSFLSNFVHSVSNTTLRIDRSPRQAYIELCGNDIPIEVAEFYGRADFTTTLPSSSSEGDLIVVGECGAVYLGTSDDADPWRPIHAAGLTATITMDPDDPDIGLAAVFVVGPYNSSTGIVWVETDGGGNYRLRQEIEWFPPNFQPWTPIPGDGIVSVTMSPDLAVRQWLVSSPVVLPGLPMVAATSGESIAIVPVAAGPSGSAGSIAIEFGEVEPIATCQAILDHEIVDPD